MAKEREIYLDKQGYPRFRDNNKPVHHEVAELKLGRKLRSGESVHHMDGDRKNSNPFNLQVLKNREEHEQLHKLRAALHGYQNASEARDALLDQEAQKSRERRRIAHGTLSFFPKFLLCLSKEILCIMTAVFFVAGCMASLDFVWAHLPSSGALGILKLLLLALSCIFGIVLFILANRLAKPLAFTLKSTAETMVGLGTLIVPVLLLYALSMLLNMRGFGLLFSPAAFLLVPCGPLGIFIARRMVHEL